MCTLGSEITLLNSFIRFVVLAFEAPPTHTTTHAHNVKPKWSEVCSQVLYKHKSTYTNGKSPAFRVNHNKRRFHHVQQ